MSTAEEKTSSDKIQKKLITDVSSLSTTMLINPEVIGEMSPTIPKKFPKSMLPKELCEKRMQLLITCLVDWDFDNVKCEEEQFTYYECKKWRDSLIFKRINEWEIDYFSKLNNEEQLTHLNDLKVEKIQQINDYDNAKDLDRFKRKRISYDIEQLSWRISYLDDLKKNFDKNLYSV
jgi:hypothetical protein